ncbi:hypothetical protein, partial [Paenibacillus larvae]|uniref:hypothetical protein n=1 Tax=Paenibacillus larvae TaxID=1464 RepID=UPI0001692E19
NSPSNGSASIIKYFESNERECNEWAKYTEMELHVEDTPHSQVHQLFYSSPSYWSLFHVLFLEKDL